MECQVHNRNVKEQFTQVCGDTFYEFQCGCVFVVKAHSSLKKEEPPLRPSQDTKGKEPSDRSLKKEEEKECEHKNLNQLAPHPHEVYCEDCKKIWEPHEAPPQDQEEGSTDELISEHIEIMKEGEERWFL